MERKLYIENQSMTEDMISPVDYWQLEKLAKENGWMFEVDDMYNYYLSSTNECEAFEEAEGVEVI